MFWGSSEAINLPELFEKHIKENSTEINILLFGACDPRHILTTISNCYKTNAKINFFILEGCIENYSRTLLLMTTALEKPEYLSIKTKTHLFMDIYGNSLIRPFSFNYICSKASHFEKILTDQDFCKITAPIFNYESLKYKERDILENTFHFWLNKKEHVFNISKYWDVRLRNLLKTRYDYRNGAFDWDLMMKLKEYGAKQICNQEYKHWRDTGIAFIFPEYEQSCANKSFATGLIRNGNNYKHRGYIGDICVGPFIAFGNNCVEEKMLYSSHGINEFRSTDITERNLYEIMFKIQEKQDYVHDPKNSHQYGSAIIEQGKSFNTKETFESVDLKQYNDGLISTENIKLYFLSTDHCVKLGNIKKRFDIIFVGSNYFHLVKEDIKNILNDISLILFETKQISVMKKEEISEFLIKIKVFSESINLKSLTNFSINSPQSVVKYKYERLI